MRHENTSFTDFCNQIYSTHTITSCSHYASNDFTYHPREATNQKGLNKQLEIANFENNESNINQLKPLKMLFPFLREHVALRKTTNGLIYGLLVKKTLNLLLQRAETILVCQWIFYVNGDLFCFVNAMVSHE